MEQRLDPAYLRCGPIERAAATAFVSVGIGVGVLLAAWGISLVWRYTPPEIAMRVANPELHVTQDAPFVVKQDKPFLLSPPKPFKIEPGEVAVKVEQSQQPHIKSELAKDSHTGTGDVIMRQVTVFSKVRHGPGIVVTGWNYKNGSGGVPVSQFCYYTALNADQSSKRVDIANDRVRQTDPSTGLVPELEGALSKCQWWTGDAPDPIAVTLQ
jgi:hypothetical protein